MATVTKLNTKSTASTASNQESAPSPRLRGVVKFFSQQKGYGFIHCPELQKDFFCHVTEVAGADLPRNGAAVEFEARDGQKGEYAARVVIAPSYHDQSRDFIWRFPLGTNFHTRIPAIAMAKIYLITHDSQPMLGACTA